MFICSVKATTLRFVMIVALSVTVLIGMSVFYASEEPVLSGTDVRYDGISTETDRREFLSALGYSAVGDAQSTVEYTMPATLDTVLQSYNELQKEQGFDLSRYAKKTVTRYTYEGTDPRHEGKVFVNLIVYRDKVIAADVTCAEGHDFVAPLLWEK